MNHLSLGYYNEYCWNWSDRLGRWREHFQHVSSFDISKFPLSLRQLPELLTQFQPVQIAILEGCIYASLTDVEFAALVKSKLKVVGIRAVKLKMTMNSVRQANLPINNTVKDLNFLTYSSVRHSALLLFPEYFRGLVHLRLDNAWNLLLQTIFKYQVKRFILV